MRIIHTSDWHLGQELHGFDRGIEHDEFLDWLATQLVKLDADALIITGDVYDTVNPPIPAHQRLYQFLRRALSERGALQIVIIGGNHDSAARLELPKHLIDANRIHLIGGMPREDGKPAPARTLIELCDKTGAPRAVCAAVPYLRPGDLPMVLTGESAVKSLYQDVVNAASTFRSNLPLLVTGHLHLTGAATSELSERRIIIGGEEAISSEIFPASIAYVALGHLHKPQSISGRTVIRYAGSPFPMSVTEKDYKHCIVMIDIERTGKITTELIQTPRPVAFHRVPSVGAAPLKVVENELRQLTLDDPGEHRRPFLEVAVQLGSAEPELRQRIEAAIRDKPFRLTRIIRQTAGQPDALHDSIEGDLGLDELEPTHIFARRHVQEYGTEPPDELKRAFNEMLISVQVPNTDRTGLA